ncbi:DUF5333 domain-containing protein [Roseovarius aestuarii]|uniref:NADH dehydrogenase subunit E n=1 Tax=Roseovarius aestuarii TaxID=475083 RepID=A0A1X7BMN0_9RHOB|nr:DUF5333 domain-containing protein [Roseovarius aestuarii]SMC10886.1 hypothetical protein ROA7745_00694 [Roseovarius aestuarii]
MRMTSLAFLTVAVTAVSGGALAQRGLVHETDINDKLLVVSLADKVNRGCGSISARYWQAHSFVNELKAEAQSRGYSRAEIDDYIEDKANRAAMRQRRDAYFVSKGASSTDPQSLCAFGYAEIQKQSQIGVLLRAK